MGFQKHTMASLASAPGDGGRPPVVGGMPLPAELDSPEAYTFGGPHAEGADGEGRASASPASAASAFARAGLCVRGLVPREVIARLNRPLLRTICSRS